MKLKYFKIMIFFTGVVTISSCKKFLDINKDPNSLPDSNAPIAQLLSSAQVNLGFEGGSDLFRFTTLIMQQMSGEASQPNQTYEYYRYNIQGSDQNNVWSSIFATTLGDLELIIKQGGSSPYYTGIAKILKAYEYSLVVDVWGKVPYSQAQFLTGNTQPAYDNDATIYPKLLQLLTDGVTDLSATTSVLTPGTNSLMYTNGGNFTLAKAQWIKLANSLKLRLLLHQRKVYANWASDMNALINTAGVTFMTSNADNFQMNFYNVANQRSPISAFEVSRPNYLFVDKAMLDLMTSKTDPRRPFYFTDFPLGSGNYVGVSAAAPPPTPNNNFSRIHTFLRGSVTTPAVGINSAVYSGDAPQRMLSYAEYCFVRAEAALVGGVVTTPLASANDWYRAGITASMTEAGVSGTNITTYLAQPGSTLTGTTANQLKQIIEEKYIALFGVSVEPWTDWRRTGYPILTVPLNVVNGVSAVPRTLFYPQSEIDLNPNCPGQKNSSLQDKVFWDN